MNLRPTCPNCGHRYAYIAYPQSAAECKRLLDEAGPCPACRRKMREIAEEAVRMRLAGEREQR